MTMSLRAGLAKIGVTRLAGMLALTASAGLVGGIGGCQANFGADVHNKTSQPLFAQLYIKGNSAGAASLAAQQRLGPGDRSFVGPVRTNNDPGRVFLSVDTLPNPGRPVTVDLGPGTAFVEVLQDGEGTPARLIVREKQ